MLLTFFYMIATCVQTWRLSALKTRLSIILQGSEVVKPSIMFYTASPNRPKEEFTENKSKSNESEDFLSSSFCNNKDAAKLGDLLWYQDDKKLCSIYPQQIIDVNSWLRYPSGITMFPLLAHNFGHTPLFQDNKMHILIEADLENYDPLGFSKATKLEDYGTIVTWTSEKTFGVILETDLDHITKFVIALMHGECFINNGLVVSRVESVYVSGKPCIMKGEQGYSLDCKKMIDKPQWDAYVKKLQSFSHTARLASTHGLPLQVKEAPRAAVFPGSHGINLHPPLGLKITEQEDTIRNISLDSSAPATPPPTPASVINFNLTTPKLSQILTSSVDLTPSASSLDYSVMSCSNVSLARSQDVAVQESPVNNSKAPRDIDHKSMKLLSASNEILDSSKLGNVPSSIESTPKKNENDVQAKPSSVLIYGDSNVTIDSIRNVLDVTLEEDKYLVYTISSEEIRSDLWMDQVVLIIVCGSIQKEVAGQLVEFIVRGGKVLALCSDLLHILLPSFRTAEVRENELVQFSYRKWKKVHMMHHIFCYQASPLKKKFSQDHEDSNNSTTCQTPIAMKVSDKSGYLHTLDVKVLGSEETWHTPSILLADLPESGGTAVFSQIHLEADPSQYEFEKSKFKVLKESNTARLEIFRDLLSTHLAMNVTSELRPPTVYSPGFFLGRHELKSEMLKAIKDKLQPNDILKTDKMEIQFCGTNTKSRTASSSFLPVMVHRCPENFSTVEYFENLNTEHVGRLVIYSDLMTSSMDVVVNNKLSHGLAIIPCRQTRGQGRGENSWLSPKGCAMFTLQLHIPLDSILGKRISLLQHLIAVAIISSVKSIAGYEEIDLRIKWPNDIYTSDEVKLGGLIVTTLVEGSILICNIGCGINLSNSSPTICINELVSRYNQKHGVNLKKLSYEQFLALAFSEIERLLNSVQGGRIEHLYEIYYKYWLHSDAEITVVSENGMSRQVKVAGIDTYGFLEVQGEDGKTFSVHPDGNSFDIMKGLITPKT